MSNDNKYTHIPYQDLSARTNLNNNDDLFVKSNTLDFGCSNNYPNLNGQKDTQNIRETSKDFYYSPRSLFLNRFSAGIYHSLKTQTYEVYVMYTLIILALIIMIMMTIDSIWDYDRTMINLKRAEFVR